MPNDYITLMLVNTAAGLLVLAAFFYRGLASPRPQLFAPVLAAAGLVSLLVGLHMVYTWPIKGGGAFANVIFGEPAVLFGAILLAAALCVGKHWPLNGVALLGLIGGVVAIVIGVRVWNAWLTKSPEITCVGFVLTGLIGLLALPTIANPVKVLRGCTSLITLLACLLWLAVGVMSYWAHIERATPLAK